MSKATEVRTARSSSIWRKRLPGILVSLAIAVPAILMGTWAPVVGAPVIAILLGTVARLIMGDRPVLSAGTSFVSKRVLQFAVVLYGLRLSLADIGDIGIKSVPIMLATMLACFVVAAILAYALRLDKVTSALITVGTAICGASAIAAASTVLKPKGHVVTYAMSTIFLFNVIGVLLFPALGHWLSYSQFEFGVFSGTAVNDTSSVVAAASIYGPESLDVAIVTKMARTLMIVPIVIALSLVFRGEREPEKEERSGTRPSFVRRIVSLVPTFIVAFVVLVVVNSVLSMPVFVSSWATSISAWGITWALAAIGLMTDVGQMRRAGVRPLAMGAVLWGTVTVVSIVLIRLL